MGMSPKRRDKAFLELTDPRFSGRTVWAIAEASVTEIDTVNILWASLSAMARAVKALSERPDCVLVDGCSRPPELLEEDGFWTQAVVGGDAKIPSVSAASILAKVHRDRLMTSMHRQYPNYGFARHKGYPTRRHKEAINAHGVCLQHRRSFKPVRQALLVVG